MRLLSPEEQAGFRSEYRDYDREIVRSFWFYLLGVIAIAGWVVTTRRPLASVVSGNSGYNFLLVLGIPFVNVIYASHLFYKSIQIHELMQFVGANSPHDDGFAYWDEWRASNQSLSRGVRGAYYTVVLLLPAVVSLAVFITLCVMLAHAGRDPLLANLLRVRTAGWIGLVVVALFHGVAFWFGLVSWKVTERTHVAHTFFARTPRPE